MIATIFTTLGVLALAYMVLLFLTVLWLGPMKYKREDPEGYAVMKKWAEERKQRKRAGR